MRTPSAPDGPRVGAVVAPQTCNAAGGAAAAVATATALGAGREAGGGGVGALKTKEIKIKYEVREMGGGDLNIMNGG